MYSDFRKLSLSAIGLFTYFLEFNINESVTFKTLENLTESNPVVLRKALKELIKAGFVNRYNGCYSLDYKRYVEAAIGDYETDDDYLWEDDLDD